MRTFLKATILLTFLSIIPIHALALSVEAEIHGNVMVQYYHYFGEDDPVLGYSLPANTFAMRHAALGVDGSLEGILEFSLEVGVSTCPGSGGNDTQVKLKEAGLYITALEPFRFGIARGHVMRGFVGKEECFDNPLCENPQFFFIFAECAMTGGRLEYSPELGDEMSLDIELGYYNGGRGTVTDEGIFLAGAQVHLPWGVSLGGHYEIQSVDYDFNGEHDDVWRASVGLRWRYKGLHLLGEYFFGKGFNARYGEFDPLDVERDAYYVQLAYEIPLPSTVFTYLQPQVMFEAHELAKNHPDGLDTSYRWLTAGFAVGLGEVGAAFKFNYRANLTPERDYEATTADALFLRLQVEF